MRESPTMMCLICAPTDLDGGDVGPNVVSVDMTRNESAHLLPVKSSRLSTRCFQILCEVYDIEYKLPFFTQILSSSPVTVFRNWTILSSPNDIVCIRDSESITDSLSACSLMNDSGPSYSFTTPDDMVLLEGN